MKRHKHNLSSGVLWTTKLGQLKPVNVLEIIPADRFMIQTRNFTRLSPLVAPMMSIIKNYTHHWYVPTWLLWDDFEDFITGNKKIAIPKVPYVKSLCGVGSLWDAMGLPVQQKDGDVPADFKVNSLAFRAYWFIYFTYYADEDLNPRSYDDFLVAMEKWQNYTGTGATTEWEWITKIPQVSWKKDIYTTARPWRLKGGDVTIPLDIRSNGHPFRLATSDNRQFSIQVMSRGQADSQYVNTLVSSTDNVQAWTDAKYASGLMGTGLDVTTLSLASSLARLRFHDGRGGSRYSELIQRMGGNSADARLFVPQYLGGGSNTLNISEVVQTSESTATSSLGEMAGHGIGVNDTSVVRRAFNEHGYVITMSFFRPDNYYMNITDRHWLYDIREDYFFKELENIGLQEITTRELYPNAPKEEVFGYNDAYYYYRQSPSRITGEFRTLDKYWHLARMWDKKPVLNNSFVECNPSNRVFADLVNDTIKVQSHNIVRGYRIVSRRARFGL